MWLPLPRVAHTVSVYEGQHDIWMRRNYSTIRTLKSNYLIIYNDIEISTVID